MLLRFLFGTYCLLFLRNEKMASIQVGYFTSLM